MGSKNRVNILGRLGADPEARDTKGGTMCKLRIATDRRVQNKTTEEWESKTSWHRVTVFGKTAENCVKFLAKGAEVDVEGRLEYSQYEKDGQTVYGTDIIAEQVTFIGGKREGGADAPAEDGDSDFVPF